MTTPAPEIQRYDMDMDWRVGASMVADAHGEWVRYEDHAAALAAKEGEIERLKVGRCSCGYHPGLVTCSAGHNAPTALEADRDRLAAENARLREAANAFLDCYRLNDTTSLSQWLPGQHCADKFRELARAVAAPQPETKGGGES